MRTHQALPQLPVIGDEEMQQFVDDHVVRYIRFETQQHWATTLITEVFVELLITDLAPQAKIFVLWSRYPLNKEAGRLVLRTQNRP